jgi:hypothetical protein
LVEFRINVNRSQRLVYVPKKILETLGHSLTIVPNTNAALLYPTGTSLEMIVKSVELILQDLKLRAATRATHPR